ncbi:hypothetical protein AK812_SmicGene36398 [Symbiodinium microadriaticum]|uniref:Uncharacterized protein n=1 Tax=Symbiodinium microadriaticum TaxID=2951 RepID=A0A1Q9CJ20_SYMMI|nr:hypothetical protein AK812_SmicGene36398 [Symbiodinium microadriaticum]
MLSQKTRCIAKTRGVKKMRLREDTWRQFAIRMHQHNDKMAPDPVVSVKWELELFLYVEAAYFVVVPMPDQLRAWFGGYDYVDAANGGTVPDPPPLLFGTFSDTDADAGEVGGTLTWTVDGTYNYGTYDYTLSDYAIYLALDAGGTGGFELATVVSESTSTTSLTAMITNVGFTDTSGSGYWIDGTVTWVAPDNPAFEYFRIVMVPARVMISPRDNIDRTARSYEIVNSDARGLTLEVFGPTASWCKLIAGSVMLTDISNLDAANAAVGTFGGDWAGLALVDSIAFTDGNPAENLLTGTVTWTFSATTDLLAAFDYGFASDWRVYIADDTQGTNRQLLGTVAKHLTEVLVYANNEHGESPNAVAYLERTALFFSVNRHISFIARRSKKLRQSMKKQIPTETGTVTVTTTLFTVGVGNVQFTDTVDTYFSIGGVLTWEEPADTSGITEYRVRLVFDVAASREQLVYEPDLGFATQLGLISGAGRDLHAVIRRAILQNAAERQTVQVYIVNGSIQQEAIYAGHALIRDNQTTHVADSIYVQELQIVDTTPEAQINITLTGELYWNTSGPEYPNVGEDWSLIDQWDIYLAQATVHGSNNTGNRLNQGDDTIIVYASNAVGKVTFTDTDTDAGTITWDPPADPSLLTSSEPEPDSEPDSKYDIYMSSDQQVSFFSSEVRKEAPSAAELRGQQSASSGDDLWSALVTVAESEMAASASQDALVAPQDPAHRPAPKEPTSAEDAIALLMDPTTSTTTTAPPAAVAKEPTVKAMPGQVAATQQQPDVAATSSGTAATGSQHPSGDTGAAPTDDGHEFGEAPRSYTVTFSPNAMSAAPAVGSDDVIGRWGSMSVMRFAQDAIFVPDRFRQVRQVFA